MPAPAHLLPILDRRDHHAGRLSALSTALLEGWPDLVTRDDAEHDPVDAAVTLLRSQRADLAWLRPHVPALEAEVGRLRGQLADASREKPGRDDLLPGTDLTVGEALDRVNEPLTHDLDGVGVVEDTDHDPDDDLDWQVLEATDVAADTPSTATPLDPMRYGGDDLHPVEVAAPVAPSAVADASNDIIRAWCAEQTPAGPVQRPRARPAPRPFHLRKVHPPDVYSHRFPWALTDRRTGAVCRYTTADLAYRVAAVTARTEDAR